MHGLMRGRWVKAHYPTLLAKIGYRRLHIVRFRYTQCEFESFNLILVYIFGSAQDVRLYGKRL